MSQIRIPESPPVPQTHQVPSLSVPKCEPSAFQPLGPVHRYNGILSGRGTVCMPVAGPADVPSPEETREMWNQTLRQSNQQVQKQISGQQSQAECEKAKKLERLLMMALNSGDMELAMLLFSALETKQANEIAKSLLQRMHDLQAQKRQYSDQIAALGSESKEDAKKANDLNLKIGDVSTEIGMLQTFLQEATAQKNEAQTMASNFLKGRHEVGMSIARNIG